jgi:putative transposase
VRYDFFIYGFVVMPNHVHLLISEPQEGTISNVIQSLKIGSAKQIRLHAKQGQKPPQLPTGGNCGPREGRTLLASPLLRPQCARHEEFFEALKYIHRNPVRRGLVDRPEDWLWSSYRNYAFDEQGAVAVESQWAAYKRKHPPVDPNQLSCIFVKDGK